MNNEYILNSIERDSEETIPPEITLIDLHPNVPIEIPITQFDILKAQVLYTALKTDSLL